MSTASKFTLGIALSLFTASLGSAAEPVEKIVVDPITPAVYGYGYGYISGGTTAYESFSRGKATLIRSVGERHLLDAEANVVNQEAVSRYLDNRVKAVQTRIARRRMGEAEQNLRHAKVHARRMTTMAINDAHRVLLNPSAANLETRAEARLRLALEFLEQNRQEQAADWLQEIETEYASTPAAAQATQVLDGLVLRSE